MKLDFDPRKNITALDYVVSRFIGKIYDFKYANKIIKNLYSIIFLRLKLVNKIDIKLKSGKIIHIDGPNDYSDFWSETGILELINCLSKGNVRLKIYKEYILLFYNNKNLDPTASNGKIKFYFRDKDEKKSLLWALKEEFAEQQYRNLEVNGREVLDIGAYVGDSAIYFILNGAKHVYAFEPYPSSYSLALKNISETLSDKISIFNAGVGGQNSSVFIEKSFKSNMGSDLRHFSSGKKINIYTLHEIIERYNLYNAILKMDCEGCEYPVILNSNIEDLKKFGQIAIEYHYGYKNLEKKLKQVGFSVKKTRPIYYNDPSKSVNKRGYVGFIYAQKVNS